MQQDVIVPTPQTSKGHAVIMSNNYLEKDKNCKYYKLQIMSSCLVLKNNLIH